MPEGGDLPDVGLIPRRCERITFLLGGVPRLFDGDPSPPTRPTHLSTSAARAMPVWPCSPRGRCLHGARTWPDPTASPPQRLALCPRAGASIGVGCGRARTMPNKALGARACGAKPLEAGVAPAYHTRGCENAHPTKAGPPRGLLLLLLILLLLLPTTYHLLTTTY